MTATPAKTLAAKLAEVLDTVGYIPKNGTNDAQHYKFVTDADVLDTIRGELAKRAVAVTVATSNLRHEPYVTAKGSPQFLATIDGVLSFIDGESGERLDIPFVGAGADSGDKGVYKAITGGVKYALLKTFLIPTGDDPENDEKPATRDSVRTETPASAPRKPAAPSVAPTDTDTTVEPAKGAVGLTSAQQAKYRVMLREAGITAAENARLFAYSVTGKYTTKDMNQADFDKLIGILKNPTDADNAVWLDQVRGAKAA